MTDYKALPQSEEVEPLVSVKSSEPIRAETRFSTFIRIFVYVLLAANMILIVANGTASSRIQASLTRVLPAHDPRTLPQPDQYVGLPETSRNKSMCSGSYLLKQWC